MNPCFNCRDRWVSDDDRCHSHCDKYNAWKVEHDKHMQDDRMRRDAKQYDLHQYHLATKRRNRRKKKNDY